MALAKRKANAVGWGARRKGLTWLKPVESQPASFGTMLVPYLPRLRENPFAAQRVVLSIPTNILNVSWRTLQVGTKQDMGHRGMIAPAEKWRNTKAVYFPPTTPTSPPMEAKFSRSIRFVTPNPSHTKVCTAVIQYFHTIRHRGCKLSSLVSHFSWLDRFDLKPPSWPGLSSPSSFLPRHSHSRSRTGSPTI